MKLKMFAARIAAIITTNLQAWHKFTASTWSGSNRLPDSSPVGTNTGALFMGRGLSFDGVNDQVTIGATGQTVRTVLFYANPGTTTQSFMQLQSTGAVRIEISGGTLSATGFTSPTLYVNGAASSTVAASSWQMISVTSATGVSASNVLLGRQNSSFYNGSMSGVKMFTTALSAGQIAELYANPEQLLPTGSVAADLVGFWGLHETGTSAYDASGGFKHGTVSGATAVTAISGAPPQLGLVNAMTLVEFDGVNDYFTVAHSADFDASSAWSMAYFYSNFTATDSAERAIYSKGNDHLGTSGIRIIQRGSDGLALISNGGTSVVFAPAGFNNGRLHHVAWTISGTTVRCYFDGALAGTGFIAGTATNTRPVAIGAALITGTGSPVYFFQSDLYEVAVWKGTVLSLSQIAELATFAKTPLTSDATNLMGWWKSTTANFLDATSNARHATAFGSPTFCIMQEGKTSGRELFGYPVNNTAGRIALYGSGYASVADAASLDITTAITIEAWVKPFTVSTTQTIAGKNNAYALNITSAAKLQFSKWTSAANASVASSASIGTTAWTHVAATYTSGTCVLYINGAVDTTSAALTGAMDATSTALLLGALTTSTNLFSGCIDNVRVYSVAMTAAQITNNYSAERGTYS
jgi:hypothetical protein